MDNGFVPDESTGAEDKGEVTQPKPRAWAVPDRPPPTRDELLRMLRADEPVSMGEIFDAVRDKRLTDEEAKEFLPEVYRNAEVSAAQAFGIDLKQLDEKQREWSSQMQRVSDTFSKSVASVTLLPEDPENPQLVAMREVRSELAGVADILKTTGEQIFTMAKLAASTVAILERLHHETTALATSSGRLETLTRWLIVFTCAVVLLTVVLVVHDLTR